MSLFMRFAAGEGEGGDFVTSNGDEERALRAVLSKLIIVRHQNASHAGSRPELALPSGFYQDTVLANLSPVGW